MTLEFMRNKVVEVEPIDDRGLSVHWRLKDSMLEAGILIKVRVPDLEIVEAEARVDRSPHEQCASAPELVKRIVGVRVSQGLRKIVRGLIGGASGCSELTEGVLECCTAVILHYTVPQIRIGERLTEEQLLEARRALLESNPRMAGSCIAFAPDSPLMQELGL